MVVSTPTTLKLAALGKVRGLEEAGPLILGPRGRTEGLAGLDPGNGAGPGRGTQKFPVSTLAIHVLPRSLFRGKRKESRKEGDRGTD